VAVVPGACERAFCTDREVDAIGGRCAGQGAVCNGKQVVRGQGVAAWRVLVVEVVGCQALAAHELAEDGLGDRVCGGCACGQVDAQDIVFRCHDEHYLYFYNTVFILFFKFNHNIYDRYVRYIYNNSSGGNSMKKQLVTLLIIFSIILSFSIPVGATTERKSVIVVFKNAPDAGLNQGSRRGYQVPV